MPTTELFVLLLLLAANSAPVLFRLALGERWMRALDGGRIFIDGKPFFGPTKTLTGLLAALLSSTLLALLLGLGWRVGLLIGGFALLKLVF